MGTTDCCFTKDNEWFRYRTAANIVEEDSVLFVQSSGCDYLYTVGGGVHVNETAEEFKNTNIKPLFLRDRIQEIIESKNILHIVSDKDKN